MNEILNSNLDPIKAKRTTPTIGLFIGSINYVFHYRLVSGVNSAVQAQGANVICFLGGAVNSPYQFQKNANLVYQYAVPEVLDGLIISGSIDIFNNDPSFYEQYSALPMVAINFELDGVPNIRVDNESGFRDLLIHLIRDHGYRRLAYIGGPEQYIDSIHRYRIYCQVLAEHGIPLDPNLVTSGLFYLSDTAGTAIAKLLDERKIQFDVVVAANDVLARGSFDELCNRGIRVPTDIAVTGFDDQDWTRYFISPLTTVRQSIFNLGQLSATQMFKLLQGEAVPGKVLVPTKLVIRNSCGCFSNSLVKVTQMVHEAGNL